MCNAQVTNSYSERLLFALYLEKKLQLCIKRGIQVLAGVVPVFWGTSPGCFLSLQGTAVEASSGTWQLLCWAWQLDRLLQGDWGGSSRKLCCLAGCCGGAWQTLPGGLIGLPGVLTEVSRGVVLAVEIGVVWYCQSGRGLWGRVHSDYTLFRYGEKR